jgi:hypothetical protein
MTTLDVSSALAAEHLRDLQTTAARSRLGRLARCCQPANWRRAATRVRVTAARARNWVRRGQLSPAANYCGCA